jgi:glucose-6-phosphate dehydrogenase assembly protein OpcA
VFTWWRRPRLSRDDLFPPLRDLSDRVILDGSGWADPASALGELAAALAEPSWKGQIVDLAWTRLDPWREAIAALFDAPPRHEALRSISSVRVTAAGPATARGCTVAGAYFAGWLASRLGWTRTREGFRRPDGTSVSLAFPEAAPARAGAILSIALEARGGQVRFTAERTPPDADFVRLSVEGGTGPVQRHAIKLPPHDDRAVLCGALQLTGRDRVFADALAEACHLVGS